MLAQVRFSNALHGFYVGLVNLITTFKTLYRSDVSCLIGLHDRPSKSQEFSDL